MEQRGPNLISSSKVQITNQGYKAMAKAQILIVEDDWIVAEDIQTSLKKLGFSVSAIVPSGNEAIMKVKEDAPELVLMDIVLEGEMNGTEAAEHIRT